MSNSENKYFVVPHRKFDLRGKVRLGNIINLPDQPSLPLNPDPPTPDNIKPTIYKKNVNLKVFIHQIASYQPDSLHPRMQTMSLLDGFQATKMIETKREYTCDETYTFEFMPTQEYLQNQMPNSPATVCLEDAQVPGPLYMITAVKMIRNARGSDHHKETISAVQRGDGTEKDPKFASKYAENSIDRYSFAVEDTGDFIFAYKLREIRVLDSGEITHQEYTNGAVYIDEKEATVKPKSS